MSTAGSPRCARADRASGWARHDPARLRATHAPRRSRRGGVPLARAAGSPRALEPAMGPAARRIPERRHRRRGCAGRAACGAARPALGRRALRCRAGPRVPRPAGVGPVRAVGTHAPDAPGGALGLHARGPHRVRSARGAGRRYPGRPGGPCAPRSDVRVPAPGDGGRPRRPRGVPRRQGDEGGHHGLERPRRQRARALPDDRRARGRTARAPRAAAQGRGPLGPGGGDDRRGVARRHRRGREPLRREHRGPALERGAQAAAAVESVGADPTSGRDAGQAEEKAEGPHLLLGHRATTGTGATRG